jgi:Domain of Unknown Function (DUF349)
MKLFERLKPRWRRSDPDERAAAAREMGAYDQGRLATLAANDPEPRVRRVAIKKLEDLTTLDLVAERDPEPALRAAARERASEVRVRTAVADGPLAGCESMVATIRDEPSLTAIALSAVHPEIRRAAASRLTGDRALREIVKQSTDHELASAALARIQDAAMLRAIALGDGPSELALAAVERIADVEALRGIAHHGTASKAVRRRARELLPEGMDDGPQVDVETARARQSELVATIQAVRAMSDVVRAGERAREAELAWQALAQVIAPKAEVATRFSAVCRAIFEDAERLARDRAEAEHARDRGEEALAARRTLCARVEALEGEDAPQQIAAAAAEWQRLDAFPGDEGADLERRFRAACAARREQLERARQHEAQQAEILAMVEEAERLVERRPGRNTDPWRRLERRWAGASTLQAASPEVDALRRRFALAAERFRQREEEALAKRAAHERENLGRVEALLARLEGLVAAESLKLATARAELKAADRALADLGPLPPAERRSTWKGRLTAARVQLVRRIAELEEIEGWRRWANTDAQEAIIARAEALRASEDLAELDARLKELQDEWAQCATASPDRAQALWERFRSVRDELRARVNAYLASNLERKRALCEQVAAVGDSTAWKETAELIKRAQAEWKAIGPVPRRHAQEIWRRFRAPCDQFFGRRKAQFDLVDEERRGNADRQSELCERAEALVDSTDWDATAAALKKLQSEWKRSGPAPRAQADALWARFRAACDSFFDRFHRRESVEREQAVEQARALCEQLEVLVAAVAGESLPTPDEIRAQLDEVWGAWIRLDLGIVAAAAPLETRLVAACVQLATAAPDALPGSRLDPAATVKRRERLCERLDALVTATSAEPPPQSLQEQVLALRERLAANTIAKESGAPDRGVSASEEANRIRLRWTALGPPLDDEARRLEERFNAALVRLEQLGNGTAAAG